MGRGAGFLRRRHAGRCRREFPADESVRCDHVGLPFHGLARGLRVSPPETVPRGSRGRGPAVLRARDPSRAGNTEEARARAGAGECERDGSRVTVCTRTRTHDCGRGARAGGALPVAAGCPPCALGAPALPWTSASRRVGSRAPRTGDLNSPAAPSLSFRPRPSCLQTKDVRCPGRTPIPFPPPNAVHSVPKDSHGVPAQVLSRGHRLQSSPSVCRMDSPPAPGTAGGNRDGGTQSTSKVLSGQQRLTWTAEWGGGCWQGSGRRPMNGSLVCKRLAVVIGEDLQTESMSRSQDAPVPAPGAPSPVPRKGQGTG